MMERNKRRKVVRRTADVPGTGATPEQRRADLESWNRYATAIVTWNTHCSGCETLSIADILYYLMGWGALNRYPQSKSREIMGDFSGKRLLFSPAGVNDTDSPTSPNTSLSSAGETYCVKKGGTNLRQFVLYSNTHSLPNTAHFVLCLS